ncbi:MAG: hypothetical protein EPN85_08730 [Bacteroidetes bacterium]|nr:MAG: hypothetical protein EPN85_08730 [Bacteroidota bacterium]
MGQFLVQCSNSGISEMHNQEDILTYPNPSTGMFNVLPIATGSSMLKGNTAIVEIYNTLGEKVYEMIGENHSNMSMGPHAVSNQPLSIEFRPAFIFLGYIAGRQCFIGRL